MFVVQDISACLLFRNAAHGGCGIERVQQVAHPVPGGQIKLKVGAKMAKSAGRARISGRAADIFPIPGQAVHDVTGYIALFFPVFSLHGPSVFIVPASAIVRHRQPSPSSSTSGVAMSQVPVSGDEKRTIIWWG